MYKTIQTFLLQKFSDLETRYGAFPICEILLRNFFYLTKIQKQKDLLSWDRTQMISLQQLKHRFVSFII